MARPRRFRKTGQAADWMANANCGSFAANLNVNAAKCSSFPSAVMRANI
jgi:hypothetical protein